MRIQSRNKYDDGLDDLDPYFTCAVAVAALLVVEGERLPRRIHEPAAGDGAIVDPLRESGRFVVASDIHDYGLPGCAIYDYLTAAAPLGIEGIVTNPPFKQAQQFLAKALGEVGYVALLLRTNFLMDGEGRGKFLDLHEPTRVYYAAPRFPMMHRFGWEGERAPSNTPHSWAIWQRGAPREFPERLYWKELLGVKPAAWSRRRAA
jgi:hypothetical protein